MASTQTAAPAPTATWRRDHFQLSPADVEARFQRLERRRQRNPDADDPLFRPIDADDFRTNGESASDFSNLRENGLVRITLPLPSNIKLIDPATDAPSAETFVDLWRSVPTVNDVALTGPDGVNPWPRGPNASGGYQLGRPGDDASRAGARCAHQSRADPECAAAAASRRPGLVSAGAVHEPSRSGPGRRRPGGHDAVAGSRSGRSTRSRSRARRCSSAPAPNATVAPDSRPPRPRWFGFTTSSSQCPRPVDTVTPARFAFAPCPPRLARNARTYEITLANGTKTRRTSSDPGRALLTGFVGGVPAQDDWNKHDMPGTSGHPQDRPLLPQQQRRHPRGGRRSLHGVLQARDGQCRHRVSCRPGPEHGRREHRSAPDPRGARAAPGVPAKALGFRWSGGRQRPFSLLGLRPSVPTLVSSTRPSTFSPLYSRVGVRTWCSGAWYRATGSCAGRRPVGRRFWRRATRPRPSRARPSRRCAGPTGIPSTPSSAARGSTRKSPGT